MVHLHMRRLLLSWCAEAPVMMSRPRPLVLTMRLLRRMHRAFLICRDLLIARYKGFGASHIDERSLQYVIRERILKG